MKKSHTIVPTGKTTVVLAGVDTLILNAKQISDDNIPKEQQVLPGGVTQYVKDWQEMAQANEAPCITSWKHEGITLKMWPHGASGWKWLLKNGYIDLMLGAQLNNAALARIRFSSEYLWKRGVHDAVLNTHAFLADIFGEILFLQVAELHLCADVTGLAIPHDYERVFVTRAKVERPIKESFLDKPIYRHHQLETVQFSGHASPMSATIYNKPKEIQVKREKKAWFYDLWKRHGWQEGTPIWRVECRLKRMCLHEMEIEDAYDALDKIPALWAYCVGHVGQHDGWLRMVKPNKEDSNRWRWATSDAWIGVQQAFAQGWYGYDDMSEVQRERKRTINLEQAEAVIAGYTATYAAWLKDEVSPHDDVSVVFSRLYERITQRWDKKGVDFQYLRRQKQFDYHIS